MAIGLFFGFVRRQAQKINAHNATKTLLNAPSCF
jgi:hypothetical protein